METKKLCYAFFLVIFTTCTSQQNTSEIKLNQIAESYVKLVLKIGLYDPAYVDAYYGPEEWKPNELPENEKENFPFELFNTDVDNIINKLDSIDINAFDELGKLRYQFLKNQILSVKGRIKILSGHKMSFNEESLILYNVEAPEYDLANMSKCFERLDQLLPGKGNISKRFNKYRSQYIIPKDKIEPVFEIALAKCREITASYIDLPESEKFTVEYVKNKPWLAYNWYQGNLKSNIQINTELPLYFDSAIDYASHEGYPGHHVHNVMLEYKLVHNKHWIEYSIIPLFSPFALVTEGLAIYGQDLIMSDKERISFERDVILPLAGLDTSNVEKYFQIKKIRKEFNYARLEISRQYLDGLIDKNDAINLLENYLLYTPEGAKNTIQFIDNYRSYFVNYTVGKSIIESYIDNNLTSNKTNAKKWSIFYEIISRPQTSYSLQ
jgi:hypothetical protein